MSVPPTLCGDVMEYFGFKLDMPRLTEMRVYFEAVPGMVVREVHHRIVRKIATEASKVMKSKIKTGFPLYSPSDRTKSGRRKRWQTPTGAMAQSVGVKVVPPRRMRAPDQLAIAYVGARMDFTATKAVKRRISQFRNLGFNRAPNTMYIPTGPKGATVRPARYFHLAAFGHGPGPQGLSFRAAGFDFMTPTIAEMRPRMMGIINQEYPPAFERVLRKDGDRILKRLGRMTLTS